MNLNPAPFINQTVSQDKAVIILEENFKIVDYTRRLEEISEFKDVKEVLRINALFQGFIPSEVRCVKGKFETRAEHSHLMIIFVSNTESKTKELGLITDYSPYGFAFTIGDMDLLREICNLKGSNMEFLHLPKADNVKNVKIGDVLEWAFYHKDQEYKNPQETPELNMGRRMFKFVSDKLSEDFGSRSRI